MNHDGIKDSYTPFFLSLCCENGFQPKKGGWIQRQHYSGIVVREENLKFSGLTKEEETQWGGGGLVAFSGVEH